MLMQVYIYIFTNKNGLRMNIKEVMNIYTTHVVQVYIYIFTDT